ncbi:phage tail protein [Sphingomonas sp.]|uniref:phage tail protein n=1 Tax=Sphingomonas sp. TaxID=28214 RepID=UPI003B3A8E9B
MATLVLTTIGSLVAGPIGGAIGAVLGNQADRALLKPKGRQGPRLGDLSVQTSAYGVRLPRLFGTMRVAGTVIWATDLREDRHHSGGGKSGPATTSYSYSASFAVALSARPIRRVGRIWADGKLLRGAAGDWKSETGFRLHHGDEAQAADPLIASAEGIDATPAHRGLAYAVFEGMQLADFGNRIPSLTFEVEADAAQVGAEVIAQELIGGLMAGGNGPPLTGFAASGDSVRGAIEAIAAVHPLSLSDDGATLRIGAEETWTPAARWLGAQADDEGGAAIMRESRPAGSLPDMVAVAYYDPARDYQAGLQRARRAGSARNEDRVDLPAAVPGDLARGLAEAALTRSWRGRRRATVHLPWRYLGARAGQRIALADGVWRIEAIALEQMALTVRLRSDDPGAPTPIGADPGRAAAAADTQAGQTRLMLVELPSLDEVAAVTPQMFLAAAGSAAGWRRAEANFSLDGGANWSPLGRTAPPAVIGRAVDVVGPASAALFDQINRVTIELAHDGMALQGADDAGLAAGANFALLGEELIQFGEAVQVAPRRFRIGRLMRGARGTEHAIDAHQADEGFLLLDRATLLPLPLTRAVVGSAVSVMALGPGDGGAAVRADKTARGDALRPLAPVALSAERLGDGTIRFRWRRRSRTGWAWVDGADAPLGEDVERYRLDLSSAAAARRSIMLDQPLYDYPLAAQDEDGLASPTTITAAVVQQGTYATSEAATGAWTL